jgi:hypothetical protein
MSFENYIRRRCCFRISFVPSRRLTRSEFCKRASRDLGRQCRSLVCGTRCPKFSAEDTFRGFSPKRDIWGRGRRKWVSSCVPKRYRNVIANLCSFPLSQTYPPKRLSVPVLRKGGVRPCVFPSPKQWEENNRPSHFCFPGGWMACDVGCRSAVSSPAFCALTRTFAVRHRTSLFHIANLKCAIKHLSDGK